MGFLATIGDAIAEHLKPIVIAKATELLTEVSDRIETEINKRLPVIIEAVVVAVTRTMGELAVTGVDRLTDRIPGQLDDQIIDPIARNILAEVKNRFGIEF